MPMAMTNDLLFAWEHDRFRETLKTWLTHLPAEGWTGNIFQLQIALNKAAHRYRRTRYSPRPTGNALGVRIRVERPFLLSHGFELTSLRTAKQRGLRVTRIGQEK